MARRSTTLALLVPWVTLAPVADRLRQPRRGAPAAPTTRVARSGAPSATSRSTCAPRSRDTHAARARCSRCGPATSSSSTPCAGDDHACTPTACPSTAPAPGARGTRRAVQILGPVGRSAMSADAPSAPGRVDRGGGARGARDVRPRRRRASARSRRRRAAPSRPSTASPVPAVCAERLLRRRRHRRQRLPAARRGRAAARRDDDGHGGARGPEGAELSELELSAVGEAMNQMMPRPRAATSGVLGQEVEIAPPETARLRPRPRRPDLRASAAPHVLPDELLGRRRVGAARPARPQRLRGADVDARSTSADDRVDTRASAARRCAAVLRVPVRVWAELGRARMPAGHVVGLPDRLGRRARPRGRRRRRPLRRRPALRHRPPGAWTRTTGPCASSTCSTPTDDQPRIPNGGGRWPASSSSTTPRSCARW